MSIIHYSERLEEIHEEQCTSEEEDTDDDEMTDASSSMSSSPSIPDENINFDLVYALHTFVATVEGQASVVKGDALILMEDTNIYWWLVEVLKTNEVGYIPAENIETPYERLARLNKHRNVEITSPSMQDTASQTTMHPLTTNVRRVIISDDSKVYHYEVESEEEEDEEDEEDMDQEDQAEDYARRQEVYQESEYCEMKMDDDEDDLIEPLTQEKIEIPQETPDDGPLQELRVFAGNIGQGPFFHTFLISYQTAAEELVQLAIDKFGIQLQEQDHSATIEYYVAVQGLDGDEYILLPQDKPLSIFKTLTDSLTTPMPSVSHIRRISQQSVSSVQSSGTTQRRPRSSSFSNYEQTNYDEDSVIRFYLHRRIKRAHENLVYIKVSLYPDTRKQKKPHEMDRMDKVIAVNQESSVGQVIQLALEKFHVPDAEGKSITKQLGKYKLSVKSHHGKEIELESNEIVCNILESLSSNTITSELLFILRKSGKRRKYHFIQQETRRPSILDILMDSTPKSERTRSEDRSILNTQQHPSHSTTSSTSLFNFTRRASAPCTDSDSLMEPHSTQMSRSNSNTPSLTIPPGAEKRKESLKQQLKRLVGWGSSNNSKKQQQQQQQMTIITSQSDITPMSSGSSFVTKSRQGSQDATGRMEAASHQCSPLSRRPSEDPTQALNKQMSTVSLAESHEHTDQDQREMPQEPEIGVQETEKEQEEIEQQEIPQDQASDIQPQEMGPFNEDTTNSSPMASSISTSKVSLVSEISSIHPQQTIVTTASSIESSNQQYNTTTTNTNNFNITKEINRGQQQQDFDDLYLLVAHGVDFLKTKENTKWEEEGGYEFHPWNRPQSSFAVRQRDQRSNSQDSQESIVTEEKQLLSPPLTPLPQHPPPQNEQEDEQAQKELAMAMAKRILSGKTEDTSPTPTATTSTTATGQPTESLDDELQRIVAAHIVF
ncbi:Putative Genomic scaffold, msy_sf_9 [Rhizopus microsporus]|nr:Putative Genomic scaffold, msy_sf_9 [Rhizopus microsporus]